MSQTEKLAWEKLRNHALKWGNTHLSEFFADDQNRFDSFSKRSGSLLLDYSKQRVNDGTMSLLGELAQECDLGSWIEKMFNGDVVNDSENRPALHTALRLPANQELLLNGQNIVAEVQRNFDRMADMVERIRNGKWPGYSGKPISTIVNLGVGGSDLGPYMTCRALSGAANPLKVIFASTMDGSQLDQHLGDLDPATTLFIIQSKSFTTIDTLSNADTALHWLRQNSDTTEELLVGRHFIAVSSADDRMNSWGIDAENRLDMWDWVGGRYSMWSAIGLPIALQIGMEGFRELLAGAHAMDQHFRHTDFASNLPVLLGLLGIWNTNFLGIESHAILPYDGRLEHLPAYLQQLEMESNGKSVHRSGEAVDHDTGAILWGQVGPNAQHAFYQLLHQGTRAVASDFIVPARRYQHSENPGFREQQRLTLANCLAQSRILALGDTIIDGADAMPSSKRYRGNQPSSTILLDELTPHSLGQLIALYEHKVFVQSVIWDINPFDQWGVELGKKMATTLIDPLTEQRGDASFDSSTNGLLGAIFEQQNNAS